MPILNIGSSTFDSKNTSFIDSKNLTMKHTHHKGIKQSMLKKTNSTFKPNNDLEHLESVQGKSIKRLDDT